MDNGVCTPEKRTIVSALTNLQRRSKSLEELAFMAENLIGKLKRSAQLKDVGDKKESCDIPRPDLIGMFEETTLEMDGYINRIGNALDIALNYID